MNQLVKSQWAWADKYQAQIENILRSYGGHMISVSVADKQMDMTEATDLVLSISGNITVALRVRDVSTIPQGRREWTIRSWLASGQKTEIDKLRDGFCDWYLYAWASGERIIEWMIIDLQATRESGYLFINFDVIKNRDNRTGFSCIPAVVLHNKGFLPACYIPTIGVARTAPEWNPINTIPGDEIERRMGERAQP